MKKFLFVLVFVTSTLSFSDCNSQSKKLMEKVMKEKYSYETDAYLDPKKSSKDKYETTVFDETGAIIGQLTLNMQTGTVYSLDETTNKSVKIYQDRGITCKK